MVKKNLFLVRHAEATELGTGQKDIDRALTPTGYQDAPRIGRYLFLQECQPDVILSSDAVRAQTTAMLLAEQLKYERHKIQYTEEIYKASVRSLLSIIHNLKDTYSQVLIVGHNPVLTYLAEYLTKKEIGAMASCGVVHLTCNAESWTEFSEANVQLVDYMIPEKLSE
jgi:phosphohistidine phosphatase